MLAYLARFGAGFDQPREAFQRGSKEGGWDGGMRALTSLMIEGATQGAFGLSCAIANNYASIGETEEAMTWLERAYEDPEPLLITAKVDSLLDHPALLPPLR